jgi:hypothetical protein
MARRVGSAFRNARSRARGEHTSEVREAKMGDVKGRAKKSPRGRTFGVRLSRFVVISVVDCFDFRDWWFVGARVVKFVVAALLGYSYEHFDRGGSTVVQYQCAGSRIWTMR